MCELLMNFLKFDFFFSNSLIMDNYILWLLKFLIMVTLFS